MPTTFSPPRPRWETPQVVLPDGSLPPTLGPVVVRWMEQNLVYGPGDLVGKPYKVEPWLREFLYRLYEYEPKTGRRFVRKALLGVPKGNSKTEVAAAIALAELCGPVVVLPDGRVGLRTDPDIPVLAASYEQADLLYGAAREMAQNLADYLDVFEKETNRRDGNGTLYRVAAVAATNDGRRPTALIADEVHELIGRKADAHRRISNGLTKRSDAFELNITTAGADLTSIAGELYEKLKRIATGEVEDPSFLGFWYEADETLDLTDPKQLRVAIRQANPASFIDVERLADRYEVDRMPEHEFRRFHLNQWASLTAKWLPSGSFESLALPDTEIPEGTRVVLGFDGSWKRDATALYAWALPDENVEDEDEDNPLAKPFGFLVAAWENPDPNDDTWRVPREEVQVALRDAFRRFQVVELVCDPYRWESEIEDWADIYGDVVIEFPTNSQSRMALACSQFYSATVSGDYRHDGNPTVVRHFANAIPKETRQGTYITKDAPNSPRKIDAAIAAIIGYHRAIYHLTAQTDQEDEGWVGISFL